MKLISKITSLIIVVLAVAFIAVFATAFTTTEITAPTEFSYHSIAQVNISGGINITAFPFLMRVTNTSSSMANISRHIINVTILNCTLGTGSTCTYGILAESLLLTLNATNDTASTANFWNYTATFTEGRHNVRLNFTNVSRQDNGAFGGALTTERIVQIDLEFNTLEIWGGEINLTSDGNISFAGILRSGTYNHSYITADGTKSWCGVSNANVWGCVSG